MTPENRILRQTRGGSDLVNGIRTEALVAPFVFIGTDEANSTVAELYRNPVRDA